MSVLILASAVGLALAASVQAASLAPAPGIDREWRCTAHSAGARWLWTRLAPDPLARPMGQLAVGPLYSERASPRRLEHRLEPSLLKMARPLWGLG